MLDMFDSAAITEAVRLLAQSRVKLAADCAATDTVQVGSTELFREGPGRPAYPITGLSIAATLQDGASGPEAVTIAEVSSLDTLRLSAPCIGTYRTANGASIGLAQGRLTLGSEAAVSEGRPEAIIDPATSALPAVAVFERKGEMSSDGGNRVYRQRRVIDVYYIRRRQAGEETGVEQKQAVQALVNLLMEDMYLGGTCADAWVSGWDFEPQQREGYEWAAIDVSRVELTAESWELWDK
ncbi:MAG: hypothetical protein ACE5JM_11580 [Armatimonadota bacterium]